MYVTCGRVVGEKWGRLFLKGIPHLGQDAAASGLKAAAEYLFRPQSSGSALRSKLLLLLGGGHWGGGQVWLFPPFLS